MRKTAMVTGGAGFIGSAVCRYLIGETDYDVVNLDLLTYAGDLRSLDSIKSSPRFSTIQGNIGNSELVGEILQRHRPSVILHLAAESHVDRSIDGAAPFIETNIVGTFRLLEAVRSYWSALPAA